MQNSKAIVISNALYFIQKARVAAQVRRTHLSKRKKKCKLTDEIMERTALFESWLDDQLKDFVKAHPAYDWFSKVKGVGDLNIGKVISLIDIKEASMISKLWRYAGYAPMNGKAERRTTGKKLHYNQMLKSMCWRLAKSLIRAKAEYYDYYREQKKRLTKRLEGDGFTIVPSAQLPKEKNIKTGKMNRVEKDGYFALGHVDTMAMRKMIKLFLSHLWLKWREAEGLEVTKPYAHAIKGHTDYRAPEEFMSCETQEAQASSAS